MLKRRFKSEKEFKDYFFGPNAERELIFDFIVKSIEIAVNENKDTADFAEIVIDGDTLDIKCERPEFKSNLQNALDFYVENEIYEKCKNVQTLIDKLS
jgi:hypothetical protein